MALTPAAKQKRYRERLRQKRLEERSRPRPTGPGEAALHLARPFGEFLEEHANNTMFYENLHWVGVEIEGDLERETHPLESAPHWEEDGVELNSLNRATVMVSVFI